MALFGSNSSRDGAYSPVGDEESKPLRVQEERHHSDSDDSRDTHAIQAEIYALNRTIRRINLYMKIVIGMLIICLIALMSINVPDSVRKMIKTAKCDDQMPLIKTPVPDLGRTQVTFEKHPTYSQRPNDISDKAWNELLPEGRGFVYIPDWEKYDYPPGQNTSWGMIYSTAVFHQMHCLGQVRRFSWMFLDAIAKNDTLMQSSIINMFIKADHAEHMNHCFDYLRQTIQCGGDMAMEWPRTEPTGERFAVDGWGIPHECKDWSKVMKYMDEKHFDHSSMDEIAPLVGATGKK